MASESDWSHETALAAIPESAGLAREFVCLHLMGHHLAHLVEDVRLVASELATNALIHARTPFIVRLSARNGSVVVAVSDKAAWALRAAPEVMGVGGRGLALVELLSEQWGTTYGEGYKSVWASFSSAAP